MHLMNFFVLHSYNFDRESPIPPGFQRMTHDFFIVLLKRRILHSYHYDAETKFYTPPHSNPAAFLDFIFHQRYLFFSTIPHSCTDKPSGHRSRGSWFGTVHIIRRGILSIRNTWKTWV